jgi:flotillin
MPLAFGFELLLAIGIGTLVLAGLAAFLMLTFYRKVEKGTALVRTGWGGTKVYFNGGVVYPIMHRIDHMDISLKRIEIDRTGKNGLICKDNLRADIKVAFFVRVNNASEDVLRVAESIGCDRASSEEEIRALFDAKFSEALKTVGKRFDFIALYEDRDTFRDEILKVIGTDLNGFVLDDAAIDYLEQAFERFPNDEVAAHLGEVLWQSGKTRRAKRVWKEALSETPDSTFLQSVVKRFLGS